MKSINVFKPTLVFDDYIKTFWAKNISNVENGKLPIHPELKKAGIFALYLQPDISCDFFILGLPINKGWKNEDLTKWNNPHLTLAIVASEKIKLNFKVQDSSNNVKQDTDVLIEPKEDWEKIVIKLEKIEDGRLLLFSSKTVDGILIKDVEVFDK